MKFDFWWLPFTGEGKELADCKLEWVENDMNVTVNYRDLERQSGQDIGDQQNSNPRQSTVHM